jgi:hypothetical protein
LQDDQLGEEDILRKLRSAAEEVKRLKYETEMQENEEAERKRVSGDAETKKQEEIEEAIKKQMEKKSEPTDSTKEANQAARASDDADPCACSLDGHSGGTQTNLEGCAASAPNTELSGLGTVCYVNDPSKCGVSACSCFSSRF